MMPSPASSAPASTRDRANALSRAPRVLLLTGGLGGVLIGVLTGSTAADEAAYAAAAGYNVNVVLTGVRTGAFSGVPGVLAVLIGVMSITGVGRGSLRGLFSVLLKRGSGRSTELTASGLADARWRAMRLAALLMPRAAGRRWLAEAENFLAEAPPVLRHGAIHSYLVSAPSVIVVSWVGALVRRTRLPGDARPRGDA